MFFLQGIARFLFVPMAEAVIFAHDQLVHPVAHARTDDARDLLACGAALSRPEAGAQASARASRNPLVRFQAWLREAICTLAVSNITGSAAAGSRSVIAPVRSRLCRRRVWPRSCSCQCWAAISSPRWIGADPDARAPSRSGTRVEDSANVFAKVQKVIREVIPPAELGTLVDNVGHARQRASTSPITTPAPSAHRTATSRSR